MNTINIKKISLSAVNSPVWYPFALPVSQTRLSVVKAEGIVITDINGREYYDAVSGLWNTPLGYGVKSIIEAVENQLGKLQFCSLFEHTSPVAEEAAVILLENTHRSMDRVIWGNTGSESIECAIKLMRGYQKSSGFSKRTVILSFEGSYHGTHYGAISVSGLERKATEEISPVIPNVMFLSPAFEDDSEEVKIAKIEASLKTIKEKRDEIAGIVIEPVLASAGVKCINTDYIYSISKLCREYDIIVAFDEVTTGFYRTGSRYYFQSIDVVPDILCLSKAINNGCLPLSAVVVNKNITRRFNENACILLHGTTMGGCTSALAAMVASDKEYSILTENPSFANKPTDFFNVISTALKHIEYITEIRSCGFMYSVVFDREICKGVHDIRHINKAIEQSGVLVYPSEEGFVLMPGFCIGLTQWNYITDIIKNTLEKFR